MGAHIQARSRKIRWGTATIAAGSAILLTLSLAPSVAAGQKLPSNVTQPHLTVLAGSLSVLSTPPRPVLWANRWEMLWGIQVEVPGVYPGQKVLVRVTQAGTDFQGSDYDLTTEEEVREDGSVVRYHGWYFSTLAEANAAADLHSAPATVEVRVTPEAVPLSVEITDWQRLNAVFIHGARMTRKGKTVTFTGRVLDEAGRPVSGASMRPVRYDGDRILYLTGYKQTVRGNGSFTVTVKPGSRGTLGVTAIQWLYDPFGKKLTGHFFTYSRPFTFRP